jgi:hypothetical protein
MAKAMEETSAKDKIQLEFFAVALFMPIASVMIFRLLVLNASINRWLTIIITFLDMYEE